MKSYLAFAAVMLVATTAQAHIVANPDTGPADSYFQTSLRVAHGCEKSATTELHVKIPSALISVHPQHKPGWDIKLVTQPLDHPLPIGHGKMVSEAVTEIVWSGGPLPADEYDDFGLLMKLPNTPGQTLWFPVTQVCEDGKIAWLDIPGKGQAWHELPTPAPFVRITPAITHH